MTITKEHRELSLDSWPEWVTEASCKFLTVLWVAEYKFGIKRRKFKPTYLIWRLGLFRNSIGWRIFLSENLSNVTDLYNNLTIYFSKTLLIALERWLSKSLRPHRLSLTSVILFNSKKLVSSHRWSFIPNISILISSTKSQWPELRENPGN